MGRKIAPVTDEALAWYYDVEQKRANGMSFKQIGASSVPPCTRQAVHVRFAKIRRKIALDIQRSLS